MQARALGYQVRGPTGVLTILDGVDLDVHAGESVAITGASGAGKSTLLGLLAGLDRATGGSVTLFGSELTGLDEDARAKLRRGRVGFVFQDFQLVETLTALENVALPLDLAGTPDAMGRARAALERLGLAARARHRPAELSGGEQQRVALARAFVTEPAVLFADEPTGNLDRVSAAEVSAQMFDLVRAHGSALLLVTHNAELAGHCDRTCHLHDGRIAVDADA